MPHMQHFTDAGRTQAEKLVQQIRDAGGEAKIDVTWKDYGADILWECVLAKSKSLDRWYQTLSPVDFDDMNRGLPPRNLHGILEQATRIRAT